MNVQVYQFDDHERIKQGLIDFSELQMKRYPGSALGVMKDGWSSPKFDIREGAIADFQFSWTCSEVIEIVDFFVEKLGEGFWELKLWFNVLQAGGSIVYHNHSLADFAAVYHIEGGGDLLLDYGDKIDLLEPVPGRMAVFPGTLFHSVPHNPTPRRISLAINAHKKAPPR